MDEKKNKNNTEKALWITLGSIGLGVLASVTTKTGRNFIYGGMVCTGLEGLWNSATDSFFGNLFKYWR